MTAGQRLGGGGMAPRRGPQAPDRRLLDSVLSGGVRSLRVSAGRVRKQSGPSLLSPTLAEPGASLSPAESFCTLLCCNTFDGQRGVTGPIL